MAKTITDVRENLFKTIDRLLDENNPMEIERAKAISDASQVLINSMKVETEFYKQLNLKPETQFLDKENKLKIEA